MKSTMSVRSERCGPAGRGRWFGLAVAGVVGAWLAGRAPAVGDEGELVVLNGGFEQAEPVGWTPEEGLKNVDVDATAAYAGKQSLRIRLTEECSAGVVNSDSRPALQPHTVYRVAAAIRVAAGKGAVAVAMIQLYDSPSGSSGWRKNVGNVGPVKGAGDWQKVERNFVTGGEPGFLGLKLALLKGGGTAWFDEISVSAVGAAIPFPPDYSGVCFEEDFEGIGEADRWRCLTDSSDRSTVELVTREHGVPLPEGGHALSTSGPNKWNGVRVVLPKGVHLAREVLVKCDFWTSGEGDSIGMTVTSSSEPRPGHCRLGPATFAHYGDGKWGTAVWRLNDYFPEHIYKDPGGRVVTEVRFVQRVKGGHEKPDGGGSDHRLVVDNVVVACGDGAQPLRELAESLGGQRFYTGERSCVVAETGGLTLWHSPSAAKVFERQPAPARKGDVVRIEAARNECESFQLVVRPARDLTDLTVAVTDLVGPEGARIPAGSVRWHPVFFLPVSSRYFGFACEQRWPGPLSWNRTFAARAGLNQPLWFTVRVRQGVPAGEYRGSVELRQEEKALASVPVAVTVWDFDFPDCVSFRTNMQVWNNVPNPWDTRPKREAMADAARLLAMYRMFDASTFPRYPQPVKEMLVAERGINTVKLPFCGGHQGGAARKPTKIKGHEVYTEEYEAAFVEHIRKQEARFRPLGVWDKCFLYIWDEPWGDFEAVKMIRYIAGLARKHFPGLQTLVAAPYYPELDSVIDIFLAGYSEPATLKRALDKGKQFWWWANSETYVDLPGVDQRMAFGFKSVQQGMCGAYAWGVFVLKRGERKILNGPADPDWPYTDPWRMCVRCNYADDVIWPGGRPESEPRRLVPSVILELLRDGIEDYEYVVMLRARLEALEAAGKPAAAGRAKELLKRCETLYEDPRGLRADFRVVDELATLRADVARFLAAK